MDHQQKEQSQNSRQQDKEKNPSHLEGVQSFASDFGLSDNGKQQLPETTLQSPHAKEVHQQKELMNNSPQVQKARQVQEMINQSPQVQKVLQLKEMINNSPQVKKAAQLQEYINNSPKMMAEKERMQNVFGDKLNYSKKKGYTVSPPTPSTIQQKQHEDEELQMKLSKGSTQLKEDNTTGNKSMPNPIKAKMENAFGTDFSNININESSKASELGALAYTQGSDIHFAPGQFNPETQKGQELLGHELTHVVQQREGKVQPTTQFKGVEINDDKELEKEADEMGKKVTQLKTEEALTVEKTNQDTSEETEVDPKTIKTEDIKYELIAHGLAYNNTIPDKGNKLLDRWGYQENWQGVIDDNNNSGFFAGLILPKDGFALPPIIAFRGTESKEWNDWLADGEPYAVGYTSFMLNRAKILSKFLRHEEVVGKKVDVTGHSLGGALAEHCAVEFPDKIRRVVTFQAPGINKEQAKQFNCLKDKPSVTSHIAEGDLVDTAGSGRLEGQIYQHYLQNDSYLMKAAKIHPITGSFARTLDTGNGWLTHLDYLLSSDKYTAQQKEIMPEGFNMQDMINAVKDPKDKDSVHPFKTGQNPTLHNEYPHPYKNLGAEFGRSKIGQMAHTQADVICNASPSEISTMPYYARYNILKDFLTYQKTPTVQQAVCCLIYGSPEILVLFLEVGLKKIFNFLEDPQLRKNLLNYLKQHDYYNKISFKQQLELLNESLLEEFLSGDEIATDLLITIPAPHGRMLITEIGKVSILSYIMSDYNTGLRSILYIIGEKYENKKCHDLIERNFPLD